jgi:hypothetical protein
MSERTYRLKPGFGTHHCKNGRIVSKDKPIVTTDVNLAKMYPDRFEDITGMEFATEHPYGVEVTEDFAIASELPHCLVWKKGRRYRIVIKGKLLDVPKLLTEADVNKAIKTELKSVRDGEKADDEDDEEEDDEDDEVVVDEEPAEEEDDEDVVKPPAKTTKPAKAKKPKK